jgi:hypothetical protein
MKTEDESRPLPLPNARVLNKHQAAAYLGIGVTLLSQIGPLPIALGRRRVYDVLDLDRWLEDYKSRGWASKEVIWPKKEDSIEGRTRPTGGSKSFCQMDAEYAKALGLET